MMPTANIPEQIHPYNSNLMMGEGGVVTVGPIDSNTTYQHMTYENFKQLLQSREGDNESLNVGEQDTIKSFQEEPINYHAAPQHDPKNLRNFFIQSSLTFNGNSLVP